MKKLTFLILLFLVLSLSIVSGSTRPMSFHCFLTGESQMTYEGYYVLSDCTITTSRFLAQIDAMNKRVVS